MPYWIVFFLALSLEKEGHDLLLSKDIPYDILEQTQGNTVFSDPQVEVSDSVHLELFDPSVLESNL